MTRVAALLEEIPPGDARREARELLAHVLGGARALDLDRGAEVPPAAAERFRSLWERRRAGEPLQYLIGHWDFYGRTFRVDRRALIPRPETEHVVEEALRECPDPRRILDLGCGSGILAITLALERPGARALGLDRSVAALALARENARRHRVAARTAWLASDWTSALASCRFDLAVANPPYVSVSEAAGLAPEVVGHEPALALFAGEDGLAAIRAILDALPPRLLPAAPFAFEIGYGQRDAVEREVARRPPWRLLRIADDLAGIPRVAVLRRA